METCSRIEQRSQQLQQLATCMRGGDYITNFIDAYIDETAYTYQDVFEREINFPSTFLGVPRLENPFLDSICSGTDLKNRLPLGKVAILLPKNALGISLSKAVAASYLAGNSTIVHLSSQLVKTARVFKTLIAENLSDVSFPQQDTGSSEFLTDCINDPLISAVVIYGDDSWIDTYWPLAKKGSTKIIFEGPGNDPVIIYPDADIESSVTASIRCGLNNGGQSCSALERFFVHSDIKDEFVCCLIERLKELKLGLPTDKATQIGPILSSKVENRIVMQLRQAVDQGATIVLGGNRVPSGYKGLNIQKPTVLVGCHARMSVVQDETFGPVFPILEFDDEEELIRSLDMTWYGLNASVYGECPESVRTYLEANHRNVYYNSTSIDSENLQSRIIDGGCKRSGIIWERKGDDFRRRSGKYYLFKELSRRA